MADQELDRNQAATPYKLEKARERGQVPRSVDVVSAVVFTGAMVFLAWHGWHTWSALFRLDRAILTQAARIDGSGPVLWGLCERVLRETLLLSVPFLVTLLLAAVAGNVLQTGPVLSVEPLKADWSRVNPVTGLQRLFSLRTLFQGARALLKLALLGAAVWLSLRGLFPRFGAMASAPPLQAVRMLLDAVGTLGLQMALMLGLIAVLDLAYTRRAFAKEMRMSRRELKEEIRHREGDPRIRSRLRELRRELLKRSLSLKKTGEADVVVTNPTHLAVALRYVHGQMVSPQVVAKGAGELAAAMRRVAGKRAVPVVQNPTLARALFRQVPVDGAVPPGLYADVARIIVWVFAMRREQRPRGAGEGRVAWSS